MSDQAPNSIRLRDIALAAIAEVSASATDNSAEAAWLEKLPRIPGQLRSALHECLRNPSAEDRRLTTLANQLLLSPAEILAVALSCAVEEEAIVGRVLAHVQAPVGGSRPTLGLMAHAFAIAVPEDTGILATLLNGRAMQTGLLVALNETAPLPERSVMVPAAICFALDGHDGQWPEAFIGLNGAGPVPLPESIRVEAQRQAKALKAEPYRALVLRSGSPAEARSVATEVANASERRPLFIEAEKLAPGVGPWLLLRNLLPVFCLQLGPGERRTLPALPGYDGPLLAVCGPDGAIESAHGAPASWIIPVPTKDERMKLWRDAVAEYRAFPRRSRERGDRRSRTAERLLLRLRRRRPLEERELRPHVDACFR